MNLYEHSEINNIEIGVLLDNVHDSEMFNKATREIDSIRYNATKIGEASLKTVSLISATRNGHCIRCGTSIPDKLKKPFCKSCFNVWAKFEDPTFEEYFCFSCGKHADTSMDRPECCKCYSIS